MEKPTVEYPQSVSLCEVGPRDGFQFEDVPIPTELKVGTISKLIESGIPRIQAMSFVHPKWVPQMADAEAIAAVFAKDSRATISALVLNGKGLDRALNSGVTNVDISIATNETHSRDNANMTVGEGVAMARDLIASAVRSGLSTQIGLQTVFGYKVAGDTDLRFVASLVEEFSDMGVESISLADSTGLASPMTIRSVLASLNTGDTPVVLHLHDTRGLGLANLVAAMECGVNRFDTSLGGMGGCPFIPGATGNIATEDAVHLFSSLGIQTGIDNEKVAACSRAMVAHRGAALPGKVYPLI